jgi:SHS2 domain-containing protein
VTEPTAKPAWQHFDHDADMGIVASAATVSEAFEQVALGMMAIVTSATVQPDQRVSIECEAPDLELLLVDWLNALIYEMAVRRMLFGRFAVRIDGRHLQGTAWGEFVDRRRHRPAVEIKGATLTGVSVRQDERGLWQARCVVDV